MGGREGDAVGEGHIMGRNALTMFAEHVCKQQCSLLTASRLDPAL